MAEADHDGRLRARHGRADQHRAARGSCRGAAPARGQRLRPIRVSVELDAPAARVWEIVEPIERHVDWMRDAESIRFDGERTRGVGTRFVCATKVGPLRLADRMEITEWEPGSVMGVRHSGVVSGTGRFTLEPIDLGRRTRFTWTEELRFPWWLGGRIGEVLGGGLVMKAIWRSNLRRLADLVSSAP